LRCAACAAAPQFPAGGVAVTASAAVSAASTTVAKGQAATCGESQPGGAAGEWRSLAGFMVSRWGEAVKDHSNRCVWQHRRQVDACQANADLQSKSLCRRKHVRRPTPPLSRQPAPRCCVRWRCQRPRSRRPMMAWFCG
jgi:hypothetical protein